MNRSRARGALLGLATGDAFGTTLEFRSLEAPPFPTLATGPHVDLTGGGPFKVAPGEVTDDTQMACCLADSLRESKGYDPVDVARRYQEWLKVSFDVGGQTARALGEISVGVPPQESGRAVWIDSGRRSCGNGSLMRTTPIAVFHQADAAARRATSIADCAVTHYDPRCALAGASFNAAIAAALDEGDPVEAARVELPLAAAHFLERWPDEHAAVEAALTELQGDLRAAHRDDPDLYQRGLHLYDTQGFVRVAYRLAFWELLHAPSWREAMIDVANRGGDADTNAAIAGALLGAVHGEDAIPAAWRELVLGAKGIGAAYHPRQLLLLL
jgi:ADP-ribosyl-[dinitrogen reductase] hydrolase